MMLLNRIPRTEGDKKLFWRGRGGHNVRLGLAWARARLGLGPGLVQIVPRPGLGLGPAWARGLCLASVWSLSGPRLASV